jgi:hypothetical protein
MHERHREGAQLIKADPAPSPFLVGSFTVDAPRDEVLRLKHEVESLLAAFFEKHGTASKAGRATTAVTFSILPSRDEKVKESQNVLEFEPGRI